MATNRDIIFTIKVRNQVKAALSQLARDFKTQATSINEASRAVQQYNTNLNRLSTGLKQVTGGAQAFKALNTEVAKLSQSRAGVNALVTGLNNLSKANPKLLQVSTTVKTLVQSFSNSTGINRFATALGVAETAATRFNIVAAQTLAHINALGRSRTINLNVNTTQTQGAAPTAAPALPGGAAPPAGAAPPRAPPLVVPNVRPVVNSYRQVTQAVGASGSAFERFQEQITEAAAATALISGPLGGVASRITALGTIIDGAGVKIGLFVLGLSGLGIALFKAAGCSVVLKPDSRAALTMLRMARHLVEAGVPEGALDLSASLIEASTHPS